MPLLFEEYKEDLPSILAEIAQLQEELKIVNEDLNEAKAQKKRIESKIAKKLDSCVRINQLNEQKNVTT